MIFKLPANPILNYSSQNKDKIIIIMKLLVSCAIQTYLTKPASKEMPYQMSSTKITPPAVFGKSDGVIILVVLHPFSSPILLLHHPQHQGPHPLHFLPLHGSGARMFEEQRNHYLLAELYCWIWGQAAAIKGKRGEPLRSWNGDATHAKHMKPVQTLSQWHLTKSKILNSNTDVVNMCKFCAHV